MKNSKRLQKLFAILLVAVMVVSVLPMGSLSVFATVGEFAGGDGTAENPYLIASKTQLNNVRNYLDANFKMIADIVFDDADFEEGGDFYNDGAGFDPIGESVDASFTGVFDGADHTISNLYVNIEAQADVYAGLFGVNVGTIKNLGIVSGNVYAISNNNAHAGGIAGTNDNGTIINCYNKASVSATTTVYSETAKTRAGGIAGSSGGTETEEITAMMDGCYNTGTVSATSLGTVMAGGVLGFNNGTITNSHNTGSVSASTTESSSERTCFVGGVLGYNSGTITNCYNGGSVSGTATAHNSYIYAGGITSVNLTTITNCYNTGTVSAYSNYSQTGSDEVSNSAFAVAGGIAGINYNGTIINCHNVGRVSTEATTQTDEPSCAETGGIVGENFGPIENCYNTGDVLAKAFVSSTAYSSYAYAGGIAGYNEATVTKCRNEGNVSTESAHGYDYDFAGGIVGYNEATISDSYNAGDVSGNSVASIDSLCLGGIVGSNWGPITTCYNIGNVAAAPTYDYDYVLGGIAGENGATITNSYYANNITQGVGNGTDTATKCTTTEMKQKSTFVGFDFETIWTIENNTNYPYPVLKDKQIILIGKGDINGDGKVDSTDYLLIKRAAFGTYTFTEAMTLAGDINSNGSVDSADYLLAKRMCFGTYTE